MLSSQSHQPALTKQSIVIIDSAIAVNQDMRLRKCQQLAEQLEALEEGGVEIEVKRAELLSRIESTVASNLEFERRDPNGGKVLLSGRNLMPQMGFDVKGTVEALLLDPSAERIIVARSEPRTNGSGTTSTLEILIIGGPEKGRRFEFGLPERVQSMALSADGKKLAIHGGCGLRLYDVETMGAPKAIYSYLDSNYPLKSFSFSPDSQKLVFSLEHDEYLCSSVDKKILALDLTAPGTPTMLMERTVAKGLRGVTFTADSSSLLLSTRETLKEEQRNSWLGRLFGSPTTEKEVQYTMVQEVPLGWDGKSPPKVLIKEKDFPFFNKVSVLTSSEIAVEVNNSILIYNKVTPNEEQYGARKSIHLDGQLVTEKTLVSGPLVAAAVRSYQFNRQGDDYWGSIKEEFVSGRQEVCIYSFSSANALSLETHLVDYSLSSQSDKREFFLDPYSRRLVTSSPISTASRTQTRLDLFEI